MAEVSRNFGACEVWDKILDAAGALRHFDDLSHEQIQPIHDIPRPFNRNNTDALSLSRKVIQWLPTALIDGGLVIVHRGYRYPKSEVVTIRSE
jgi:hypothetical protein